ncbi:hypothetical protein GCM10008955_32800 [Deinococcus malanensis]|uniref:Response regulatory domain-containing protein n=1 Tax=Deinococcus malanensis TaxID=1706855 RepID=A0ABQ2EZN8_9DEIO|nr:response regulator [Deinococcus malanensis]GGK36392.1 hypothetical protein GCM10008955_32800 [Deinococcus malanensis]
MLKPTVMLVEDNTAIRTLQRVLLIRAGYTIVECADLAGSRQVLSTVCPAVVVLDVHLPDGYGLVKSFSSGLGFSVIPDVTGQAASAP